MSSIGVLEFQLRHDRWSFSVGVPSHLLHPHLHEKSKSHVAGIPTVRNPQPHGITPFSHQARNVIGVVVGTPVIVRPTGGE